MLLNHYLPKKNNTTVTHQEISFTLQTSEGNTSSKGLESPKLLSLPRLRVSLKTKVITTPTSCHFTNSAFLIVWLSWGSEGRTRAGCEEGEGGGRQDTSESIWRCFPRYFTTCMDSRTRDMTLCHPTLCQPFFRVHARVTKISGDQNLIFNYAYKSNFFIVKSMLQMHSIDRRSEGGWISLSLLLQCIV